MLAQSSRINATPLLSKPRLPYVRIKAPLTPIVVNAVDHKTPFHHPIIRLIIIPHVTAKRKTALNNNGTTINTRIIERNVFISHLHRFYIILAFAARSNDPGLSIT
jgi:hypothetical protein